MQPLGTPCWLDMQTDLDRAVPFYAAVLGWELVPVGEHRMAFAGGAPVALLSPSDSPGPWRVYLACQDIDLICGRAQDLGARVVLAGGRLGDLGRMASFQDPGGTLTMLWQADKHQGFQIRASPGVPVWFENWSADRARTRDFYAQLFGLQAQPMPGMDYGTLHSPDGAPRFGVGQREEDGGPPAWMVYLHTPDCDAASAQVSASEGTVSQPPTDTPFGRIAVCADPLGARFTLITPAA